MDEDIKAVLNEEYSEHPLYPFLIKYFENYGGTDANEYHKQTLQNIS